jgi:hypothetical protein
MNTADVPPRTISRRRGAEEESWLRARTSEASIDIP